MFLLLLVDSDGTTDERDAYVEDIIADAGFLHPIARSWTVLTKTQKEMDRWNRVYEPIKESGCI